MLRQQILRSVDPEGREELENLQVVSEDPAKISQTESVVYERTFKFGVEEFSFLFQSERLAIFRFNFPDYLDIADTFLSV
jgi:hypothetical protein